MSENAKYPDTARGRVSAHVDALRGLLADQVQAERSLVDANEALNAAYRERAHLVALLAAIYPSEMHENPDADYDNWPIVMVKTPAGQMGWHLAPNDVELFDHVIFERTVDWDKHSTEEKYRRVRELASELYEQGIEAVGGHRGAR